MKAQHSSSNFNQIRPMNNKLILLVEDDEDHEELTLLALKQSNIMTDVVVARNGAEALDYLFRTGPYAGRDTKLPQLILLDLKLPKVDGIEVLRRLRAADQTKLLPVVILTSSTEECDLVNAYSVGANSYIRKPVDFDKFTDAVQRLGLYWLVLNEMAPIRDTQR
jgi:two-component system, response regulator